MVTLYKKKFVTLGVFSLLLAAGFLILPNQAYSDHTREGAIFWYNVCKQPLVDMLIMEDCRDLISKHDPQDQGLSMEGYRVIACLGGGALGFLSPQTTQMLQDQADRMNIQCGGR